MSWSIGRNSLQNENTFLRRKSYDANRRSSSADGRGRSSVGPTNVKVRPASEERKSSNVHGWGGARRSSLFNDPKGSMKDPRPLSDKNYQKAKILQLIEYLQKSNFPYPLTPGKLVQPSKKDFENIFQHFITCWDEGYVVKKIEEEAPKILKDLCYPFIPNKSAFQYVARTNWPQLLGVLLFLMDISAYLVKFDAQSTILSTLDEEHRVLLEFIFNIYLYKNEDEESVKQMFTKIVKQFRFPTNIDELAEENEKLKNGLEEAETEINNINYLKKAKEEQSSFLEKYEDYMSKFRDRYQKKQEAVQKVADELASIESELRELTAVKDEKQEAYDAQGFDGKKQVSYFEEQRKELAERLQAKKATLKELQQKCWETEMQCTNIKEEGTLVCEAFNERYSSVSHALDKDLDTLRNIKDPQVRSLCSNLRVVFPDCKMQLTQNALTQGPNLRMKLEEIKQKVDSATVILHSLKSKQSQIKSENEMKMSALSISIKLASAEEIKKERELSSNAKQVKGKQGELEAKYDEILKRIEQVQAERMEAENKNKELLEELHAIENLKKEKQKIFQDYLREQQELFSNYTKTIEESKNFTEECGKKVYEALQKNIK